MNDDQKTTPGGPGIKNEPMDLPVVRSLRFRVLGPADLDEALAEKITHLFQNTFKDILTTNSDHEQIQDLHLVLEHAWESPEVELY